MTFAYPLDPSAILELIAQAAPDWPARMLVSQASPPDQILSAVGWEIGRGWFPTLPDRATLHEGFDLGLPESPAGTLFGMEVTAIGPGTVVHASSGYTSPEGFDLGRVLIQHETPFGPAYALYLNLADVLVWPGLVVDGGTSLGHLGHHGEFTHLHFAIALSELQNPPEELAQELAAGQWPEGDALWNVLRVRVDELSPLDWPDMPPGPWTLVHPVEFVRACRGDPYQPYVGAGHDLLVDTTPVVPHEAPAQEDQSHVIAELLHHPQLAPNATLHELAGNPAAPAIEKGTSDSDAAKAIQSALHDLGYPLVADGDFGNVTKRAVLAFQTDKLARLQDLLDLYAVEAAPQTGAVDTITLLGLDRLACAALGITIGPDGKSNEPPAAHEETPASTPAPQGAPPPRPAQTVPAAEADSFVFDQASGTLSMQFGMLLYKKLLEWEVAFDDDGKVTAGCKYSCGQNGSIIPYKNAYEAKLKGLKNFWSNSEPVYPEWPVVSADIEPSGTLKLDGDKSFPLYTVYDVTWVGTGSTNCCISQAAAFAAVFKGKSFTVHTASEDKTYWMGVIKAKEHEDRQIDTYRATYLLERLLMSAAQDAQRPDLSFYWNPLDEGGLLAAVRTLELGKAVGKENGIYSPDNQETFWAVRMGDWANTPTHAWLVADVEYGVWFKGKNGKVGRYPDLKVCQSSFVGDAFEKAGPAKNLTAADCDWVRKNEAVLEQRLADFVAALASGTYAGKEVAKKEVRQFRMLSANAYWGNSKYTVDGLVYDGIADGAKVIDKLTKDKDSFVARGISRKWTDGIPTHPDKTAQVVIVNSDGTLQRDRKGRAQTHPKETRAGTSFARFYAPVAGKTGDASSPAPVDPAQQDPASAPADPAPADPSPADPPPAPADPPPASADPAPAPADPAPADSAPADPPPASADPAPAPATPPPDPAETLEERRYDYFKALIAHAGTLPRQDFADGHFDMPSGSFALSGDLEFNESEGAINVIGIRSMMDWKAIPGTVPNHETSVITDRYDDWLVQVWIEGGKKRCVGYAATVDPGHFDAALKEKYTKKNIYGAHLNDGQYRYQAGTHGHYDDGPKEPAPGANPLGPACVWSDHDYSGIKTSKADYWMPSKGITKHSGIDIHYGYAWSADSKVRDSSAACQVLRCKGPRDKVYQEFIGRILNAANAKDFPYTLLDSSVLPGPIPTE
ncbi:MAG: peptidoglycan DD-metalloendopeptidase family protein [Deltaproteobacteria bacterium]|nr:peptidoglycan DD-metalloendopeptidase family protein [Deltaproteobacteria bacterium]